jgi:hypothetical protein
MNKAVACAARSVMPGYWRAVGDVMECPVRLAAEAPGSSAGRSSAAFAPGDDATMDMGSSYEVRPSCARWPGRGWAACPEVSGRPWGTARKRRIQASPGGVSRHP